MGNVTKIRNIAAEFIATLLFVFVSCGSGIAFTFKGIDNYLGIALAFGLSITVLAYAIGHHSGGHINPMVTVGLLALGKVEPLMAVFYIIAQCLGSICGSALLLGVSVTQTIMPEITNPVGIVVNRVNQDVTSVFGAWIIEFILSFLLMYVIIETAVSPRAGAGVNAPIAIGFSVFMAHIVCIPFTGTSINPARSLGPAIVANDYADLWIFLTAPFAGGLVAAGVGMGMGATKAVKDESIEMA